MGEAPRGPAKHSKTVSDARTELNRVKGLAELSLSKPNGPTPDVTHFDGNVVQKDVTVDATVKPRTANRRRRR